MIVRVLNKKKDTDKFFDCSNSCLHKTERPDGEELSLIVESPNNCIEVLLDSGDEIYYMNDAGKTIHADYRLMNE